MKRYLQLVATGPELSKSLDSSQAEDALSMILNGDIDPVRSGIFLIALRMKRETDAENIGVLNALNQRLRQATAGVPELLAIADPFNGCNRGLPTTPFLPAVLAACGLPTYCHGMHQAGPKYGITINQVLKSAGKQVDNSVEEAVLKLDNTETGWAYLDQASYLPELHQLVGLRDTMVKRTCISTLEVVLRPVCGSQKTHLMTGFVHKAYPPVYRALAKQAGFDSAMIVRGVEGGSIPSLSQVSRYFSYQGDGEMLLHKLAPAALGIEQEQRAITIAQEFQDLFDQTAYNNSAVLSPLVEQTVELGLAALAGRQGLMYDSLVYGAAIALHHTGVCSTMQPGADLARQKLDSGEALVRFNSG
jgi:anthranilate phosphoribosyltransferase